MNEAPKYVTGKQIEEYFSNPLNFKTIRCNKTDARKIAGHFISKGYWMTVKRDGTTVLITMAAGVEMEAIRKRLTVEFTAE